MFYEKVKGHQADPSAVGGREGRKEGYCTECPFPKVHPKRGRVFKMFSVSSSQLIQRLPATSQQPSEAIRSVKPVGKLAYSAINV